MFRRLRQVIKNAIRRRPHTKKINYPAILKQKNVDLLLQQGFSARTLKNAGYGVSNLIDFGFGPRQIIKLGFKKEDLLSRSCGFQAIDYRKEGITANLLVDDLGFTAEDLRSRYFSKDEILAAFRNKKY